MDCAQPDLTQPDLAQPDLAQPDVYVICLKSMWAVRGARTVEFLERELGQRGPIFPFDAVTPADFDVADVAAVSQTAIIRGRAPRITHADMSKPQQVACFLSHRALWKVCADTDRPIVVVEDDARPSRVADRLRAALLHHGQCEPDLPLVVLLQCAPRNARFKQHAKACVPVEEFAGAGMYFVAPAAARLLLAYSALAPMHVDLYISTCITAYDLAVYAVPGAADQDWINTSTLMHSSVWDIASERQTCTIWIFAIAAISFAAWAIVATWLLARSRRLAIKAS